jgi:hypothetical protein
MKYRLMLAGAVCLAFGSWIVAQPQDAPGAAKGGPGAGKGAGKGGPGAGKGRGGFQPPEGPAPKTAWGVLDLNGVWQRPYVPDIERANGGPLPYTEWGKKAFDTYNAEEGDYTGSCLPFGHSRAMGSPDPIQIVLTPTSMAFLYEQNSWFKVFPIDGRPHNPKKVPTWFGDSIGHWEGDTMVVDTTNFNGFTRLDTNGHPHSNQLHMIEKFTRTDLGHIAYQVTYDDPKTYTKPIVQNRTFTLRPDWEIQEYSCEENNKGLIEGRIKVPDYENAGKQ